MSGSGRCCAILGLWVFLGWGCALAQPAPEEGFRRVVETTLRDGQAQRLEPLFPSLGHFEARERSSVEMREPLHWVGPPKAKTPEEVRLFAQWERDRLVKDVSRSIEELRAQGMDNGIRWRDVSIIPLERHELSRIDGVSAFRVMEGDHAMILLVYGRPSGSLWGPWILLDLSPHECTALNLWLWSPGEDMEQDVKMVTLIVSRKLPIRFFTKFRQYAEPMRISSETYRMPERLDPNAPDTIEAIGLNGVGYAQTEDGPGTLRFTGQRPRSDNDLWRNDPLLNLITTEYEKIPLVIELDAEVGLNLKERERFRGVVDDVPVRFHRVAEDPLEFRTSEVRELRLAHSVSHPHHVSITFFDGVAAFGRVDDQIIEPTPD